MFFLQVKRNSLKRIKLKELKFEDLFIVCWYSLYIKKNFNITVGIILINFVPIIRKYYCLYTTVELHKFKVLILQKALMSIYF